MHIKTIIGIYLCLLKPTICKDAPLYEKDEASIVTGPGESNGGPVNETRSKPNRLTSQGEKNSRENIIFGRIKHYTELLKSTFLSILYLQWPEFKKGEIRNDNGVSYRWSYTDLYDAGSLEIISIHNKETHEEADYDDSTHGASPNSSQGPENTKEDEISDYAVTLENSSIEMLEELRCDSLMYGEVFEDEPDIDNLPKGSVPSVFGPPIWGK